MPPTRVRDPLATVLRRVDPDRRLRPFRLWTFWVDEVGETIAAQARPVALRAGVLTVAVSNHAWMQDLQFLRQDIVRRLNERLGEPLIEEIFLVLGTVEGNQRKSERQSRDEARTAAHPAPIPSLRNPNLAAVFERLAQAQARRRR
jgi:predicted nucleic acid-binding Zn ribbon protein